MVVSVNIGQIECWVLVLVLILTPRRKYDGIFLSWGCETPFLGRSRGLVGLGEVKHGQHGVEAGPVDKYTSLCRTSAILRAAFQQLKCKVAETCAQSLFLVCISLVSVLLVGCNWDGLRHRTTSRIERSTWPYSDLVRMITNGQVQKSAGRSLKLTFSP